MIIILNVDADGTFHVAAHEVALVELLAISLPQCVVEIEHQHHEWRWRGGNGGDGARGGEGRGRGGGAAPEHCFEYQIA